MNRSLPGRCEEGRRHAGERAREGAPVRRQQGREDPGRGVCDLRPMARGASGRRVLRERREVRAGRSATAHGGCLRSVFCALKRLCVAFRNSVSCVNCYNFDTLIELSNHSIDVVNMEFPFFNYLSRNLHIADTDF